MPERITSAVVPAEVFSNFVAGWLARGSLTSVLRSGHDGPCVGQARWTNCEQGGARHALRPFASISASAIP